jgi:processing peptidase subunit alpha
MVVTAPEPLFTGTTPTQVTTLSNGLKVASSDLTLPCATVGVYIEAGSCCDSVSGTAHMLQHMAFKSSSAYSHLRMVRAGEHLGAVASATAGRENMVYQVDTLKSSVPEVVEMLADGIFEPKLLPWEVEEQKEIIKMELEDAKKNPQQMLQDLSHTAAFGTSSPLGKPLMCPPKNLGSVTPEMLKAFIDENYCPSNMVLAAAGYDHDELVALAEASFGKYEAGSLAPAPAATYAGGEVRLSSDDEMTHFALSFKAAGWKGKELVPLCVLNTMMGGGASFSAGGPGKGMYTRLYQNILNRYGFVQAASVFTAFYNDVGIFGVYGTTSADCMGQLVATICEEMKKMAVSISAEELARAKNQLKTSLLMNLESRPVLFEDIGRQVLTYGARTPPEELVLQIEAVTATDLINVSKAMLKTPPSIAVYGDTTSVPRYDQIASQFG